MYRLHGSSYVLTHAQCVSNAHANVCGTLARCRARHKHVLSLLLVGLPDRLQGTSMFLIVSGVLAMHAVGHMQV